MMKLAWVTPVNLQSSIAGIGVDVAEGLAARGHRVEIWASEFGYDPEQPRHSTHLTIKPIGEVDFETTDVALAIVNFGDHFMFHAGCLEVLGRVAVVGVFHDFFLHNLFLGWLWGTDAPPDAHRAIVEALYGPGSLALSRRTQSGEIGPEEAAARIPMTEWAARRCQGAIVHADFYRPRIEAACPGPIDRAYLTSHGRKVPPLPKRRRERVVALTVGMMNPNKRCDAVIAAIGASEALRARVDYVLAGTIKDSERARLRALAAQAEVRLTILGHVDDAELERRLAEADLIFCLRQPVLEGASGSAIEALMSGRPAVVVDAGFYAELPDELVVKVGPAIEPAELTQALERLVADEALRRRMGAAAAGWARETFTLERYLDVLEPVMKATAAALPRLRAFDRLGRLLGRMGLRPGDPASERVFALLGKIGGYF
jgi:glycosyltransferase involved in cell wall biosynthesis